MKTNLFVGALMIMSSAAFAQMKIAPEIGATMYNHTSKASVAGQSVSSSSDYQPGLRAGAVLDITISDHFSLQPGLFYTLNRTKSETSLDVGGITTNTKATTMLHAAQLPVYAVYKTGEEGSGRFFVGLGGYVAYNIAGTQKVEISSNKGGTAVGTSVSEKMKFGNSAGDHLRPLDYGPSAMLGYELSNGLYVRGHFNYGLSNLQPQGSSDLSVKSMTFGLSFGYFFGGGGGYGGW